MIVIKISALKLYCLLLYRLEVLANEIIIGSWFMVHFISHYLRKINIERKV